jgi:hypothetical protein
MVKNFVRAGVVILAMLALTGCVRADGLTKEAERQYTIECLQLGGEIREVYNWFTRADQCVFTFPNLPKDDEH